MTPVIAVQCIASLSAILCAAIGAWAAIRTAKQRHGVEAARDFADAIPTGTGRPPRTTRWIGLLAGGILASFFTAIWTSHSLQKQSDELIQHTQRLEQLTLDGGNKILVIQPPGIPRSADEREEGWTKDMGRSTSAAAIYRNRIKLLRGKFRRQPTIIPSIWGRSGPEPWSVSAEPVKGRETEEFDLVVVLHPPNDQQWIYVSWTAFDAPETSPPKWSTKLPSE
jgi:hypothetical protein